MTKTFEKFTDPREAKEFLESLAILGAGAKIFKDGVQYTQDAGYWQFMADTFKGDFKSVEAVKQGFLVKPDWMEAQITGKGYEWDWFNHFRDNPFNIGKVAHLSADANDKIDATVRNVFSGHVQDVQLKARLTDNSINSALQEIKDKHAGTLVVGPEELTAKAKEVSLPHKFESFQSIHEIDTSKQERIQQAEDGNVSIGVNWDGVLIQVGRDALIGAAVYASVSVVSHFKAYKRGEISGEEYARLVLSGSVKGAIMGGGLAFINIPVQLTAAAVGVGMPVTIPVMIVCGYGLRKIIAPVFKEGRYAEIVQNMSYSTEAAGAWVHFTVLSCYLYESQEQFLHKMSGHFKKFKAGEKLIRELDKQLQSGLEEI